MKKRHLILATATVVASSMMLSSCIGSFALTNKVLAWNKQVSNKFVNELVFVAFHVLPVYPLTCLADLLVINSIEFWSGNNPAMAVTKVVDGRDARYMVKSDEMGYTITNLNDQSVTRFNFDAARQTWSVEAAGQEYELFTFVDDNHVRMSVPGGGYTTVELSQAGVLAYEQLVENNAMMALR